MTYSEEQKRGHVYTLQNALYELHKNGDNIPRVNPDGHYGPETTESVRAFQHQNQLPATGAVDHITWDAIFARYFYEIRMQRTPVEIQPFPGGQMNVERGQTDAGVGMVQVMLWALSRRFSNIRAVPITLTLDEATLTQLRNIQRLYGLPQHDALDTATWNAITVLFNLVAAQP